MNRYILVIAIFLLSSTLLGNNRPEISLLTCSGGDELYSKFGHSALRVHYLESGNDVVFNFGVFDFNTPNFYVKFIRGKLKYKLDIQQTRDFIAQYEWEGRVVFEQKLNLTERQIDDILARLEYLYKPENRYYYYSFLYKNCTSELRDLVLEYVDIPDSFLSRKTGETNRELLNKYTDGWSKFGINLLLGSSLERDIDVFQRMFLPENLMEEFCKMEYSGESLVREEVVMVDRGWIGGGEGGEKEASIGNILSPVAVSVVLLVIAVCSSFRKKIYLATGRVFFTLFGFIGLFLVVVTSITEHIELYWNYNMLWCNPLFLIPALFTKSNMPRLYGISVLLLLISLIVITLIWTIGLQYAETGFIIIVLALVWLLSFTRIHSKFLQ